MTDNVLGAQRVPRFFHSDETGSAEAPAPRRAVSVRTAVRSLAGMQKEAIVTSSRAPGAWRLVSDEGPYLNGHDEAPFPLAFLSAGMAASYTEEVVALAAQRGLAVDGLRLSVTNRYTMEGSAIRGTMVGGALAPEVRVELDGPVTAEHRSLVMDAVDASPLNGVLRGTHTSLFSITHDDALLEPKEVAAVDGPPVAVPTGGFEALAPVDPRAADLVRRIADPEERDEDAAGGPGSSLRAEQSRVLHVEAFCVLEPDGTKQIDVALRSPAGSTFRLWSAEPDGRGPAVAPDAATLISAGIGFCFMTQLGRYATIRRRQLDGYEIVQDTHFSLGGASGGTGRAGEADAVETHVAVRSSEDGDFIRELVDMGERTCFLHALCRTPLKPKVDVRSAA